MNSQNLVKISAWIRQNSKNVPETITLDLNLIENRIISSLKFPEFILFLEDLSGKDITLESLRIENIQNLAAIEKNFFGASHAPA